jgi:biopolymer transport protein TolQ
MNSLYLLQLITQIPSQVITQSPTEIMTQLPTQVATQIATATSTPKGESVFDLFMQSGYMGKGILVLLVLVSIISWGIALERYFYFKKSFKEINKFQNIIRGVKGFNELKTSLPEIQESPIAELFLNAYNDLEQSSEKGAVGEPQMDLSDELEDYIRTFEKASIVEAGKLEKRLIFLATAGATTPFVGLFGTVWGIMNSFQGIAVQSSASFAVIAGGISEALVNTAAGLAAAIPAVVFYNYFVSRIKAFGTETNSFSKDFLRIIKKHLKKR